MFFDEEDIEDCEKCKRKLIQMEVHKIIADFDTAQMILSKHITTMVNGEAHISIRQFDELTNDLIVWKNQNLKTH